MWDLIKRGGQRVFRCKECQLECFERDWNLIAKHDIEHAKLPLTKRVDTPMRTVDDMTDLELQTELDNRRAARKKAEIAEGHAANAKFLSVLRLMGGHAKDLADSLCPEHDCVNCSDSNLANSWIDHNSHAPRCARCYMLLIIKDDEMFDHLRPELRFKVRYTP